MTRVAVLPTRDAVLLPGAVNELTVGRPGSVAALRHAAERDEPVLVLLQLRSGTEDPGPGELHDVGTLVRVTDATRTSADAASVGVVGVERVKVLQLERSGVALFAEVEAMSWQPVEPEMPEVLRESLGFLIDQGLRLQLSTRTLAELRVLSVVERLCAVSVLAPIDAAQLQLVLQQEDLRPIVVALLTLQDGSWLARFLRWLRT